MNTRTGHTEALPIDGTERQVALPLRRRLRHNAAFSGAAGAAASIGFAPLASILGVGRSWLVLLAGIWLVLFAVGVLLISQLDEPSLVRLALEVSLADFGWVAGTATLTGLGLFSGTGSVVMASQGGVVAWFGITQLHRRRLLLG